MSPIIIISLPHVAPLKIQVFCYFLIRTSPTFSIIKVKLLLHLSIPLKNEDCVINLLYYSEMRISEVFYSKMDVSNSTRNISSFSFCILLITLSLLSFSSVFCVSFPSINRIVADNSFLGPNNTKTLIS